MVMCMLSSNWVRGRAICKACINMTQNNNISSCSCCYCKISDVWCGYGSSVVAILQWVSTFSSRSCTTGGLTLTLQHVWHSETRTIAHAAVFLIKLSIYSTNINVIRDYLYRPACKISKFVAHKQLLIARTSLSHDFSDNSPRVIDHDSPYSTLHHRRRVGYWFFC